MVATPRAANVDDVRVHRPLQSMFAYKHSTQAGTRDPYAEPATFIDGFRLYSTNRARRDNAIWLPASSSSPFAILTLAPGNGRRRATFAERHEIAARYAEWEIIGPAEIREVNPDARYFNPHVTRIEMPRDLQPAIDALETFLMQLFLRRYITYCARRRRYAAMNGAAELYANLRSAVA